MNWYQQMVRVSKKMKGMAMYLQKINYSLTKALISVLFVGYSAHGMERVAGVQESQEFPLHDAAKVGDCERIRRLVEQGKIIEMRDEHGDTPLHCAAGAGKIESIDCLIKLGADKEALNLAGYTPIMKAKSQEIADHLRKRGAREQAFVKPAGLELIKRLVKAQLVGGNFALHWAAAEGHVEVVKALLAAGADREAQDKFGWRPLHWAAMKCRVDVVKVLLAAGADKEAQTSDGETPLHYAAFLNMFLDELAIDFLILVHASGGMSVKEQEDLFLATVKKVQEKHALGLLQEVASVGRVDTVEALLAAGADKEAQDKSGNRPLHMAARSGQVNIVKTLLAAGADKEARNRENRTPLHDAAAADELFIAAVNPQILLHLAEEKTINEFKVLSVVAKEAREKHGSWQLHEAAAKGRVDVVKALLAAGVNKEAQDKGGCRPLHLAALFGSVGVVKALLGAGAEKEAEDKSCITPLHFSVRAGQIEVAKELLASGASKHCRSHSSDPYWNGTPLEIARKQFEKADNQISKDVFKNLIKLLRK